MIKQIQILKRVLDDSNIPVLQIDQNGNCLSFEVQQQKYFFVNSQTPFNRQDILAICKDKEYSSNVLQNTINIPKTKGYLDPNCLLEFRKYCKFGSNIEVQNDIVENFAFPLILKPNKGSMGLGVLKIDNIDELTSGIEIAFNQENKLYDYVMLVQEYIDIKQEFRVFCVDRIAELVYLKDNSLAQLDGNLSPLHWVGSSPKMITNNELLTRIQTFINPIFAQILVFWSGLDVVIDQYDKMFLIEINTAPSLSIFLEHNPDAVVYHLYQIGLKKFLDLPTKQ